MIKKIAMLALAAGALAGCAKGPDGTNGGPVVGQARNRMTISMTLASNVNSNYYYDFAFDDDGDISDGPAAIVGQTAFANGVVGGSFTVLVQLRGGAFSVYRRTRVGDLDTGTEDLQLVPNAFVVQPSVQTGRTISFTLNLDATYTDRASGQELRLFRNGTDAASAATSLDVNFVATDEQRRDPNLQGLKSYDAFGFGRANSFFTIRNLGLSQQYTNQSSGVRERDGDVVVGTTGGNIQSSQIDITDFSITVLRSS